MVTVVTREANGIPLTHEQVDANFTGLADAVNIVGADVIAEAEAARDAAQAAAGSARASATSATNSANAASISRGDAAAAAEQAATSAEQSATYVNSLAASDGGEKIGVETSTVSAELKKVERIENFAGNQIPQIKFNLSPIGVRPDGVVLKGAATAVVTTAGYLSVVSAYTAAADAAIIPKTFTEGRIVFVVKKGVFMLGFHIFPDGSGWRVWSSDGARVELGFVNVNQAAVNLIPSIAMPGAAGDDVNVEVEVGPMAQGLGISLRTWVTDRPTTSGATVTLPADGTNGMIFTNEGVLRIETFSTTPTVLKSIQIEDGSDKSAAAFSQVEFVGRWFPRYEWGKVCMATIRQGSAFRFNISGTDIVTAEFAAPSGKTQNPILAVYVNGVFLKFITITVAFTGFINLATGLDPNLTSTIEVFVSGIQESDPKWLKGCGVLLHRVVPYAGTISPYSDKRPKALFEGDSITEAVAAKGTPGVSLPQNSCGEASFGVVASRLRGLSPVINGFGGSGLTVAGNGGVPAATVNSFFYMKDRSIVSENIQYIVVNLGTNDANAGVTAVAFEAAYTAYIRSLRAAYPSAKIFAMRPFNGVYAANIATVATNTGVYFVDTAGWLTSSDFNDGVHPTPAGHLKAGTKLSDFILAKSLEL